MNMTCLPLDFISLSSFQLRCSVVNVSCLLAGTAVYWRLNMMTHACFLAFHIQNLKLLTFLISFFLCTVVLCFFISGK